MRIALFIPALRFFGLSALPIAWAAESASASGTNAVLQIDAGHITARVSPTFAGLMTEEINHAYDGGLYAELLPDRAMNEGVIPEPGAFGPWSLVGGPNAEMALDVTEPLSGAIPTSIRIDGQAATPQNRIGVANGGYWGIPVRPGTRYRVSFSARSSGDFTGPLTASIESPDGTATYGRVDIPLSSDPSWKKYEAVLTTSADAPTTAKARFVISTGNPGTFWLTLVSLFPPTYGDRPNGNRIDLMEKLAALHPKFLRFPGGNYLEGDTVENRFDWKKTIGDPSRRPGHAGPWGYWSSDGLGLLEFLNWCEDLAMEPVLGIYAGLSLQDEAIPAGPKLAPFVQDALDEIEYVTGAPTTPWGARRAQDGHPEPFKLTYVEVGNEDDFNDRQTGYEGRFAAFFDAIKAKYPSLQLIATMAVKSRQPDVLDEHFYRSANQFFLGVGHYDAHDRKGPKIFAGEWATLEGSPTPNMHAALSDAAWMIGMERNSDLVIMQSYAPLLANVNDGAYQWWTNLIGYNALNSYGSPSYYAQVMFNSHRGDEILESSPGLAPLFFHSVTKDSKTGTLYLKAVNASGKALTVRIDISGAAPLEPEGKSIVLSGQPNDTNSIDDPEIVVPVETLLKGVSASFEHTFPADSITVFELHRKD